jgi:hypothetical protein
MPTYYGEDVTIDIVFKRSAFTVCLTKKEGDVYIHIREFQCKRIQMDEATLGQIDIIEE